MLIEIQFREASDFMWAMFRALPEEVKPQFATHIDRLASALHHPTNAASISVECSSEVGRFELSLIQSEPGWPPAQPPSRGYGWPPAAPPPHSVHGLESGSCKCGLSE